MRYPGDSPGASREAARGRLQLRLSKPPPSVASPAWNPVDLWEPYTLPVTSASCNQGIRGIGMVDLPVGLVTGRVGQVQQL